MLRAPQISPDSVVLEIETVHFSPDQIDELKSLWDTVDEQHLPVELRRRLANNGLRCGLIDFQVPAVLRAAISDERPALDMQLGGAPDTESPTRHRQLPCRAGKRYEIVVTEPAAERVVVLNEEGRVWAESFSRAQGRFSLICNPLGDGRVKIAISPLVEHGEPRKQVTAGSAGWIMGTGQAESEFDYLRIDNTLSPGATLIITSSDEPKGLGQWFFGDNPYGAAVLIRLLRTQHDDLFTEDVADDFLATPLE